MTRILSISLAAVLLAGAVQAQTNTQQQQPEKPRPKPGTILETPSSGGRITDAPTAPKPSTGPAGDLTGQTAERFEVGGNTSASMSRISGRPGSSMTSASKRTRARKASSFARP